MTGRGDPRPPEREIALSGGGEPDPPSDRNPASSSRGDGLRGTLLLVEDNPGDARLLEEMLAESAADAWELQWAESLAAALERLREESGPDAVLLDLDLPDSRGLETVRAAVETAPSTPIVVLTGLEDTELGIEAVREGAQDYLVKGQVGPRELERSLRYAMEREETEARTRRRSHRFRALVSNLSDVITVVAGDGTIQYESPSVERVLGYGPEERVGVELLEQIHPQDREEVRRLMKELADHPGAEEGTEARFRHADGSWRLLETRGRTPPEEAGLEGTIFISRDVTDTRRAQRALEESRERFRALAENAADGIVTITTESRILYANPAMEELFGYEPEELEGSSLLSLIPEELRPAHRKALRRYLETDERTVDWGGVQFPAIRRDGNVLEVEISFGEYTVEGERLFTGMIRDISDQKETERRLREERERFRQVAENVREVFWLTPPDKSEMLYISPAYEAIMGRSRERLYEDPGVWLDAIHPEDRPRVEDALPGQRTGEYEERYRIVRPDGEVRWLRDRAYPVRNDAGEVVRLVGVAEDVTEEHRAREALQRAKEKFKGIFELSPVGLKIVDPETDEYLEINEVMCHQLGYGRTEILDGRVASDDFWERPERRRQLYARVEEGETVAAEEARFRRKDGSTFDGLFSASLLELGETRYLVAAIQDVSYLKEVERQLEQRATHDHLTGLPNRMLVHDRLEHALRRAKGTGAPLAVLLVDLKRFKVVNDSLGHDAGDRVLVEVARRLRTVVPEGDTVGRFGGDEFVVLLEAVKDEGAAVEAAERVAGAFEEPVNLGGNQVVHLDASVGVAVYDGGLEAARIEPSEFLRWSDRAMHRAKETPGTEFAVAQSTEKAPDSARLHREARLREAIEQESIRTVFQPIFGLPDGGIRGVEALARWTDPELGEVGPGSFIPLAEETGLIIGLGGQQLHRACSLLLGSDAPRTGDGEPLRLHVNLSARQLEDPEVVDRVQAILEDTGFPAERLCLEVTETAAMREAPALDGLKELGVSLALDDFGTGYSTLGQLRRIPVDTLKIDRSFVDTFLEERQDRAIVEAILTLAHSLGLTVVAEGVESAEQLERLRELDCDDVQGYHLSRPVDFPELDAKIETGAATAAGNVTSR